MDLGGDSNPDPSIGARVANDTFSSRAGSFERGPAAAGPSRVRVLDRKTRPGKSIVVIESRAAQIIGALAVDQEFDPVFLDYRIARLLSVERDVILQSGAPALGNLDSQSFSILLPLSLEQDAQLTHCFIGHVDH